jgi:hypothetical protein
MVTKTTQTTVNSENRRAAREMPVLGRRNRDDGEPCGATIDATAKTGTTTNSLQVGQRSDCPDQLSSTSKC